jgi:broad specificity phosphatase PhoE
LSFAQALTSPLQRARRTAKLAGFGNCTNVDADLTGWHYGAYEARRTADNRAERPGWRLFEDGCAAGKPWKR